MTRLDDVIHEINRQKGTSSLPKSPIVRVDTDADLARLRAGKPPLPGATKPPFIVLDDRVCVVERPGPEPFGVGWKDAGLLTWYDNAHNVAQVAIQRLKTVDTGDKYLGALGIDWKAMQGEDLPHDWITGEVLFDEIAAPLRPTGIAALDREIGGLAPGELTRIMTNARVAGTALLTQIARRAAIDRGDTVAVLCIDSDRRSVVRHLLAPAPGLSLATLEERHLDPSSASALHRAKDELLPAPLFLHDARHLSTAELCARVRGLHQHRNGLDLVVLLGVQELSDQGRWYDLQALAAELRCPIVYTVSSREPDSQMRSVPSDGPELYLHLDVTTDVNGAEVGVKIRGLRGEHPCSASLPYNPDKSTFGES